MAEQRATRLRRDDALNRYNEKRDFKGQVWSLPASPPSGPPAIAMTLSFVAQKHRASRETSGLSMHPTLV
jgi:hypothetical protein